MRRKTLVGLLILFAVPFATVAGMRLQPGPMARRAELITELEALGAPVTFADRDAPIPPPERNGAHDLDAAQAWLDGSTQPANRDADVAGPWNDAIEGPWEENSTPEQMEALTEYLATLGPLFEKLDQIAEKPEIAWPLGPRNTAATVMELDVQVALVQSMAKYLDARAVGAPTPDERLRAIRTTLALGSRLRGRTMIGVAVACAVQRGGAQQLRRGLESGHVDPLAAREELDELLSATWDTRFHDVLRGERAWVIEVLPYWIDGSLAAQFGKPPSVWEQIAQSVVDLVGGGRHSLGNESPTSAIEWASGVEATIAQRPTPQQTRAAGRDRSKRESDFVFTTALIRKRLVSADAISRLGRVALAAYEHRRVHGDWPENCADLTPLFPGGVPVDPFTDAPFAIQFEGDDLILRANPWEGIADDEEELVEEGFLWRLPPR